MSPPVSSNLHNGALPGAASHWAGAVGGKNPPQPLPRKQVPPVPKPRTSIPSAKSPQHERLLSPVQHHQHLSPIQRDEHQFSDQHRNQDHHFSDHNSQRQHLLEDDDDPMNDTPRVIRYVCLAIPALARLYIDVSERY